MASDDFLEPSKSCVKLRDCHFSTVAKTLVLRNKKSLIYKADEILH